MQRDELLAALAAATGPDRALDAEIAAMFERVPGATYHNLIAEARYEHTADGSRVCLWIVNDSTATRRLEASREAPRYTASLDAALTLVPEGWTVGGITQADNKRWWAELREGFATSYDRTTLGMNRPTPALALCIAALSARAP